MPHVTVSDGTKLYYESTGTGPAIVFVHELAGSYRSFDAQVAALKSNYRCIVYNARGYPPSDVPPSVDSYSQDYAASDIAAILDALNIGNAHIAGVSMGSASSLQFALKHTERVRSLVLCAIGTGSDQTKEEFEGAIEGMAGQVEKLGLRKYGENFANTPNRKTLREHNPKEYDAFIEQYSSGSVLGHDQHDARRAEAPSAALCAQGSRGHAANADAGDRGRERCTLPQAFGISARHDAEREAGSRGRRGACGEFGEAGGLQPARQ